MIDRRLLVRGVLALLCAGALGACSSYQLRGKVIHGDASYITIVDADDPRLNDEGVAGVEVMVMTDPGRLNRKVVAKEFSAGDGTVELPVSEFGAGLLEYNVGVFAKKSGYMTAEGYFQLPPDRRRLLIMVQPGRDTEWQDPRREDFFESAEKYMR